MFNPDESYSSTRLITAIRSRIYRLIGRSKLTTVKNSKKTQLIQVKGLSDETITDIERFQEYGFESYPKKDAEALIIFPGGNRDQGCVVCVMDTRYRPDDLKEEEVQIYDYKGSKVYLKEDGTIRIEDSNGNYIKSTSTQWDINGNLTIDK